MVASPAHVPAFVHSLAQFVDPWRSLFNDSKPIGIAVLFAHLGALMIGGGFAVAADRTTLRVLRQDRDTQLHHLDELHAIHRPILFAIAILFVSGLLMAAADVETFAVSIPFWIKISCVTLLLINGGVLYKTEEALRFAYMNVGNQTNGREPVGKTEVLWRRLRSTAIASLVLWTTTVLAGTVLAIAA
ncbi:MAG TPA: hypothetical protein VNU46_02600 [Gemmatimonadaceae bacterium]|jgi:hypothetical protein|nr:hypothetical protein [Gemmatimonadaceae bacterium]